MRVFPYPRARLYQPNNVGVNIRHRSNLGDLSPRRRFYSNSNRSRNRVAPDLPQDLTFNSPLRNPPRNCGRFKPICKDHAIIGPGKFYLAFSLFSMLGLLTFLIILHKEFVITLGSSTPYFGYILWILTVYYLLSTALTDPGIMPKNVGLTHHLIKYGCRDFRMNRDFLPTYCKICRIRRPPRTYHCKECDICIRRQDMHVTLLGTCVGERNFGSYYLLNLFLIALAIYLFITNCIYLSQKYDNDKAKSQSNPWVHYYSIAVINIILASFILALPQTGLLMFLYRFYLFAKDRTAREEFRLVFLGRFPRVNGIAGQKSFIRSFKEHLFPYPPTRSYVNKFSRIDSVVESEFQSGGHWNWLDETPDYLLNGNYYEEDQGLNLDIWNPMRFDEEQFGGNDDFKDANLAKRKAFFSMPTIYDGALKNLPSARHRLPKRPKLKQVIESNLKHHQEFLELPKAVADNQFHKANKRPASFGDLPTVWNQATEEEILHQARATQMLRVIELIRTRDRRGLIQMGRRVNIGALLGVDNLDPDFLQIIELNNNGLPVMRGRQRGTARPNQGIRQLQEQRNQIGVSQLIAAGLLSRHDGTMFRDLLPRPGVRNPNFPMLQLQPRIYVPQQLAPFQGIRHHSFIRNPLQPTQVPYFPTIAMNQLSTFTSSRLYRMERDATAQEIRTNTPSSSVSGNRANITRLTEDRSNNNNIVNNNINNENRSNSESEAESSNSSRRGLVFHMNRSQNRRRRN